MSQPKQTVSAMIDPDHATILRDHAEDCARSVSKEFGAWLAVGACAVTWSDTFRPDKQRQMAQKGWTPEQLEDERLSYLEDLSNALVRALPHAVDPGAVARAMMPATTLSAN